MTQTDGLGSPEADTDGASEPSHLRCPEKKGLMSPEQDCRETEDGGRNAESSNTEVESHLDEPPTAVHELSGGTEKAGNVRQGWQDPCPSANNNEASCQSGSIVFPVNPAVRLLSNQDIQTKDSTKAPTVH